MRAHLGARRRASTSLSRQNGPMRTPSPSSTSPSKTTSTSISTSRADADRAAHVEARRIGEARALHAQRARGAPLERALELRQLPRVVGAFGFDRVGDVHHLGGAELGRGRARTRRSGSTRPARCRCAGARASAAARSPSATMMPVLTVRIARCSSSASLCSTIAADAAFGVAHDAAVAGRDRPGRRPAPRAGPGAASSRCSVSGVISGTSPYSTSTRASSGTFGIACCTAWPVPSCCACSAQCRSAWLGERGAHLLRRRGRRRRGCPRAAARARCRSRAPASACPAIFCSTLGRRGLHALAFAGGEDDDVQRCAHADSMTCRHGRRFRNRCRLILARPRVGC